MHVSIVIPAHNEANNIESFVTTFIDALPERLKSILLEIIIVENGSIDSTLTVCKQLHERYPTLVRVIPLGYPSYGEALKKGITSSKGTHLSVLECDLLDSAFVEGSVALFREGGTRFIVGSKRHPDSEDRRPLTRRLLTQILNCVLRLGLGYPGSDTRGLKSIETRLARQLCNLAVTDGEAVQTELVLIAWKLGVEIREIPISVSEERSTTFSVRKRLGKSLEMLRQLRSSIKGLEARVASYKG